MLYLEKLWSIFNQAPKKWQPCQGRLGYLLLRSGEPVEALECAKRASAFENLVWPDSSSTAKTLSNIDSMYSGKREREKALRGIARDTLWNWCGISLFPTTKTNLYLSQKRETSSDLPVPCTNRNMYECLSPFLNVSTALRNSEFARRWVGTKIRNVSVNR